MALDYCFKDCFQLYIQQNCHYYSFTIQLAIFLFVFRLPNFSKLYSKVILHPLILTRLTRSSLFFTLRMTPRRHFSTLIIDADSSGGGGKVEWNSLGCCQGCNTSYECHKRLMTTQSLFPQLGCNEYLKISSMKQERWLIFSNQ